MRQTFRGANGRTGDCGGCAPRLSASPGPAGRRCGFRSASCERAFATHATLMLLSSHLMAGRLRRQSARRLWRKAPYLDDVDPALAEELYQRLARQGFGSLADSVFDLKLVDVCHCRDRRCASFYTIGRFHLIWLWPHSRKTVDLGAAPVMRVDVMNERIVAVEVFERPRLRQMLRDEGGRG